MPVARKRFFLHIGGQVARYPAVAIEYIFPPNLWKRQKYLIYISDDMSTAMSISSSDSILILRPTWVARLV